MVKIFRLEAVKQNTVSDCILYEDGAAQRFLHGDTPPVSFGSLMKCFLCWPCQQFPRDGKQQVLALRDLIETLSTGLDIHRPTNGDPASMIQYDRETVEEFVKREGFGTAAQNAVKLWTCVMFGLEPSNISALYFLWYCRAGGGLLIMRGEKELAGHTFGSRKVSSSHRFLQHQVDDIESLGTQSFSQQLAACLKSGTVHLNTPAKRVSQSRTGSPSKQGTASNLYASAVIITVPSPSYSWITFNPLLPEPKRILSGRAMFGHTMKVILVYSKPWWREYFLCGFA